MANAGHEWFGNAERSRVAARFSSKASSISACLSVKTPASTLTTCHNDLEGTDTWHKSFISISGRNSPRRGSYKVTAEEIKEFGQKYDPQPFHLNEAAGENSLLKGLAASGWLTAAVMMRLRVQSVNVFGGMIGTGVEDMRWTEPVRPGDLIRTEIEVFGMRRSTTRKDLGIVRTTTLAYNQEDKVVLRSTENFLALLRNAA